MAAFGCDHKKIQNYGWIKREHCDCCNSDTTLNLQKVSMWITVFGIPIITYKTNYILTCPICNTSRTISSNELYELIASTDDMEDEPEQIESDNEIQEAGQFVLREGYITQNGAIYRTETQMNFIRQMCEFEIEKRKKK